MKLLIEVENKEHLYSEKVDGIILALEDYAVESTTFFSLDEIYQIREKFSGEIFIKINKNLLNEDIEAISTILEKLDKMDIQGVFFYDLAILELKNELHLSIPLIWNQTHMVNNYKTCDYYYSKGVKYALLGKELTLDEVIEIIEKSKITSMVEVVSKPSIAFSRRSLLTNYGKDLGKEIPFSYLIHEKVSNQDLLLVESDNGTSFFMNSIMNGTSILHNLYQAHCPYIIMREYGLEEIFLELVHDTMKYIADGCVDSNYIEKYKKLGNYTNFFFQKTVYRVKKNG